MPDRNKTNDRNRNDRDRNVPEYSLQSREYRGRDGKEHHHTNVWMSRHDKDGEKANSNS